MMTRVNSQFEKTRKVTRGNLAFARKQVSMVTCF